MKTDHRQSFTRRFHFKCGVLIVFLGLMGFGTVPAAFAQGDISLVGALNLGKVSESNPPAGETADDYSAKTGIGGGVLFNALLVPDITAEFGMLYLTRKFQDTTLKETTTVHMLQIPLVARYWVHPMASIGAGGYWETGMGRVTTVDDSSGANVVQSFSNASLRKTDLGAIGSLGFRFPLSQTTQFLADARYTYGFSNVNSDGTSLTQKYRDIQFLAGLTFGMATGR